MQMTAHENPFLFFVAFVCLAAAIFLILKYYRHIALFAFIVVGGGALLFGGLGLLVWIGSALYEEYTAKQCLTLYERRAHAFTAPDDYFGRQLREQVAGEAKRCAELAAKREAATQKH